MYLRVTIPKESFYESDYTNIFDNALARELKKLHPKCHVFSGCFTADVYTATERRFYEMEQGMDVLYKQMYESAQPENLHGYYPKVEVADLPIRLILKNTKAKA